MRRRTPPAEGQRRSVLYPQRPLQGLWAKRESLPQRRASVAKEKKQ